MSQVGTHFVLGEYLSTKSIYFVCRILGETTLPLDGYVVNVLFGKTLQLYWIPEQGDVLVAVVSVGDG